MDINGIIGKEYQVELEKRDGSKLRIKGHMDLANS